MRLLLFLVILLQPTHKKHWSEAHKVGLTLPSTWTVVAQDQDDAAFVIDGPELGLGTPRAVLKYAGAATERTLDELAKQLVAMVQKREGWRVVAQTRKRLGVYPAVRVGIAFVEDGSKKGRARFTAALLGGRYFVLELSAAASHFPGKQFDKIEKSLDVPWSDHKFAGLTWTVPEGWSVTEHAIEAPMMGLGRCVVMARKGDNPPPPPEGSKPGPKLKFLGAKRATTRAPDKTIGEVDVRMVQLHADGWGVAVMVPVEAWDDLFPMMEKVLASAKRPKPQKK